MAIEGILVGGVIQVLKNLVIPVVGPTIGFTWSLKNDLRRLQGTLEMILAVIADAEEKREKNNELRLWLKRLKDVAYDADDVLDDFSYETMRRSERESFKYRACDFFSSSNPLAYRRKLTKRIKEISIRVDKIAKDMQKFQLQTMNNSTATIAYGGSSEQRSRQTASIVTDSQIVGRKEDKNKIVDILSKATTASSSSSSDVNYHSSEKVSIVSIVGMGGLGKTTLAQLVYKDELVNKCFDQRIWVCVSTDFDVENILIKIMESITQAKFDNVSNFDLLVKKVEEKLQGKKYLLVLDDLWNEDQEQWDKLKSVLLVGAQGSRILITTRNAQVASVVLGTVPPYHLGLLSGEACWSMMKQKAFSPGGAFDTPRMTEIGKDIAKKCFGLPLAAKFLGSLLHSKNQESDWIYLRDDDIWNAPESQRKILPVLKLSYINLPSHLKQCFSYCSIFPKNWEIKKETLIQLWMAEGFLKLSDVRNRKSIEDFGRDYFESLAWSSFFQDFKKNQLGDIETCKMHDLVHDLAKDVVGENELVSPRVSEFKDVSEVRRLQLDLDQDILATFLKSSSHAKKLRTLFIPGGSNLDPCIFSENNHLRILHVGQSPNFTSPKLRSLSFKLKHLRYLSLTSLDLREVENDQCINKLYNLEMLVLNNMFGVQFLLSNIQPLKKLRYLEVSFTDMEKLPDSVTSLSDLQTLDLNHSGLLKVIPDSISGLKILRFLNLSFNPMEELPVSVVTLSNLETLDVKSCKYLKTLPESVAGLANLRIFDFNNCPLLRSLPDDIGALTQLRYLSLIGTEIAVLPESSANLRNIELLYLFKCELPKHVANWTKLREFYYARLEPISGIGKLLFLEKLMYLVPEKETECSVGIEELANLNFLEELYIWNLQNVKNPIDAQTANLKGKHNLVELLLNWHPKYPCTDLQVFEALQPPTCLKKLIIKNFMGWDLPTWKCVLPNLEWLDLENCKGIKKLPAYIGQLPRLKYLELKRMSLKSLDISGFPSLIQITLADMFLLEELLYSHSCLQNLWISGCKRLTEIPSFPSLWYLDLKKVDHKLVLSVGRSQIVSLTRLFLDNIEDLIYFPISILQNNCNIQILQIKECNQFEGFGVNDDDNENVVPLYGPLSSTVSLFKHRNSLIAHFLSFFQIYKDGLLFGN